MVQMKQVCYYDAKINVFLDNSKFPRALPQAIYVTPFQDSDTSIV